MFGSLGGNFAGGATFVVGADISEFRAKLSEAKSFGSRAIQDLSAVGRQLLVGGAALGGGVGLAARDFARLDDELRAVRGIAGASVQQFDALEKTVRGLGATTSFTAVQVGEAAKELARGGQSIEQIQATLRGVLDLARGTQSGLDFSAASVVRTLGQFNKEAGEAARVVDVLAKASNSGTFVLEDLGESLKFLGPIGDSLGFSLEEVSAAFAVLADRGLRGGIAGRQLRRVFFELTDAQKLQRLETELGIKGLVNSAGEFASLEETIRRVSGGLAGLAPQTRVNIVEEIFGEGAAALEGLAKGVDDLNGKLAQVQASDGYARQLADTIDGGLGGAIRIAVSAATDLSIELGKIFSADLIALAQLVRDLSGDAAEWARNNQGAVKSILAVTAALIGGGGLLLALGGVASVIATVVTAAVSLTAALGGLGVVLALITAPASLVVIAGLLVGLAVGATQITSLVTSLQSQFVDLAAGVGKPVDEVDKLLARLNELASKRVLDKAQFNEMRGLVSALEGDFGKLGARFDEATGKAVGVQRAIAKVEAARVVENNEAKLKELVAERNDLDRAFKDAKDPETKANKFLERGDVEAEIKNFTRFLEEARAELKRLGGVGPKPEPPGGIEPDAVDPAAKGDEKRAEAVRSVLDRLTDANGLEAVRTAIEASGGTRKDLGQLTTGTDVIEPIAELLRASYESNDPGEALALFREAVSESGGSVANELFQLSAEVAERRRKDREKESEEQAKVAEREKQKREKSLDSRSQQAANELKSIGTRFRSGEFGDRGLSQQSLERRVSVERFIQKNTKESALLLEKIRALIADQDGFPIGAG